MTNVGNLPKINQYRVIVSTPLGVYVAHGITEPRTACPALIAGRLAGRKIIVDRVEFDRNRMAWVARQPMPKDATPRPIRQRAA